MFVSLVLWHYKPFSALASFRSCHHSYFFPALLLHPSTCRTSLWTSPALTLDLPTCFSVVLFSSIIVNTCQAHLSLLLLIIFKFLYNHITGFGDGSIASAGGIFSQCMAWVLNQYREEFGQVLMRSGNPGIESQQRLKDQRC